MNSILVNGRFSAEESEQLLNKLFQVKKDFHHNRVLIGDFSKEERVRSTKRLKELEAELERIREIVKTGNYQYINLRATLSLEFCPDYERL